MTQNKRIRIYISGKISGLPPEIAEENFKRAERVLRKADPNCTVVNPYLVCKRIFKDKPDAVWLDKMDVCIKMLRKCDVIYLLSSWNMSDGAIIEFIVAEHECISIMYESVKHSAEELLLDHRFAIM